MANVTLGLPESTGVRVFYDNAVSGIQVQSLTSGGAWTELQKLNISTLNNDSNFLTESDISGLSKDVVTVSTNLSTLTENFNTVSGNLSDLDTEFKQVKTTLTENIGKVSSDLSDLDTEFAKVSADLTNNINTVSGDLSDLDTEFKQVSSALTENIETISGDVDKLNITINNLPVEFLSSLTPDQYNVLTGGFNNLWKLEGNNYSLNIPVSSLPSYLQASHSSDNLSSFVTNVINNMNFATVTPLAEFIDSFDVLSGKLENNELNNRTIYLVPNAKNSFDEYIVASSKLELLGPAEINIENYVLKEDGKGLSTNDYTTADKTKLSGIETGAQVNTIETIKLNENTLSITDKSVNIDLSQYALSSDIPTKVTDLSDASNYVLSSDLAKVAKSGSYEDLTDKPTNVSEFNNDAEFITSSAVVEKAKALETGRKIELTGAVVGSVQFDGSQNVVINAALGDSITIDASKISGLTVDFNNLLNIPSGTIVNKSIKFDGQTFTPTADNESIDISNISGLLKLNWNNITNKPELATKGELSTVSSTLTGQIKENKEYSQTVSSTLLKDIKTVSGNLLEVSETVDSLPVEFLSSLTPDQYNVLTSGLNNLWKLDESNKYSLILPEYLNADSPDASNLSAFVSGVVDNMGVKNIKPIYEIVTGGLAQLSGWAENQTPTDGDGNAVWNVNADTIYLVSSNNSYGAYDEYICLPFGEKWKLEQIGSTKIDLSGYAKLEQISSFITSGDVISRALVADKLSTGRKIELTGPVTGSAQFDGSKDISIDVSFADGLSLAWTNITDIPSGKIENKIDAIKYNDTIFTVTDKTADLSNLSGVFQAKGDYVLNADLSGYLTSGIISDTISESNINLLPTVSAVIDYVASNSGSTYSEGPGISLSGNVISIKAATDNTLGGIKTGDYISVNESGEVTVEQANKVKNKLTINGTTYDGSKAVSINIEANSGSSANIVIGDWSGEVPSIPSAETGLYFDRSEEIPWIYDALSGKWYDLSVPPILSSAIEENVVNPLYIASVGSVISYVNNKFSDKMLTYFSDEPSGNNKDYYINCIPTVSAVMDYTNEKLSGIKLQPGLSGDILTNGIGIEISQDSGNALTIKDDGLYVPQSSGSSDGSSKVYFAGSGLFLYEEPGDPSILPIFGVDLSVSSFNGVPQIARFTDETESPYGSNSLFVPASVVDKTVLTGATSDYSNIIGVDTTSGTATYYNGTDAINLSIPVVDNIDLNDGDISGTVPTVAAVINYVGNNAGSGESGNATAGVSSLIFTIPNLIENESAKLFITDLYDESISGIISSVAEGEILDNTEITGPLSGSIFSKLMLKVPLTGSLTGLSDYCYQWIVTNGSDTISGLYAYSSVYGQQVPGSVTSDDIIFNENAGIYSGSTLTQVTNDLYSKVLGTRNYVDTITFENNTCNEISGAFTDNTEIDFNIPSGVSNATCIFQTASDWSGKYTVSYDGEMFINKTFEVQQNKQAMYIINVDKNIITWTMLEPVI